MKNEIAWLGHATILIQGEKRVMVDPWKLKKPEPVDIVLVTHDHYDHCSPEDVEKVTGPATSIIAPPDAAARLGSGATSISPGETLETCGVTVEAVAAYNVDKQYHPKSKGWVGYVVTMGGERIYVAGDTDRIPEMDAIRADVVVLPVGGTYTMNADEAAEAANRIGPGLAIPIHFGDIVGTEADARRFESRCSVPVKILAPAGRE